MRSTPRSPDPPHDDRTGPVPPSRIARYVPQISVDDGAGRRQRAAGNRRVERWSGERPLDDSGEFVVCPHCHEPFPAEDGTTVDHRDVVFVLRLRVQSEDSSLADVTRAVKRTLIVWALRESDGVKVAAAELVGLKYSTFWEMAKRLGVSDAEIEAGEEPESTPALPRVEAIVLEVRADGRRNEVRIDLDDPEELFDTVVRGFQRAVVSEALAAAEGVLARAAEAVEMKYPTFYALVGRLGLGDD